jgi:hypothetical protein
MAKSCIISAVGKGSFHKSWIDQLNNEYDLHLLVYDDSYDAYKNDSSFVIRSEGQKFKLIFRYLNENRHLLEQYDYYYFPDDDIFIDDVNIRRLFKYMADFRLAIAQPALTSSFYTHHITVRKGKSILRYTNFVEVMQPCFSNEALKNVLFTFNENLSGWGMDYHWGELVDYKKCNMAIIDDITSVHTRQVGLSYQAKLNEIELEAYLKKFNLTATVVELKQIEMQN